MTATDTTETIRKEIAAMASRRPREVKLEDTLYSLGLDSLDILEVVMSVEERLGIEFSDQEVESLVLVSDVVNLATEKMVNITTSSSS